MDAVPTNGKYTVVARRYRPKTFAELVGQGTVAQALLNAIHTNRVGHAYLFTGARGVGKTSTARIFAKALNASANSSGDFDPNSDIAQAIDTGEDMDVIEIDGASNRGIDEIRQLRANAAVRPSRSPYKIYIIDEVHMLTPPAFNALLKTLEEPPGHVKFIFCTTDPEKMPITVLSRCQRFDFPPVHTSEILGRLKFICENEGKQADEAALQLVARRAAGSMRDSQSLLEQLLSFCGDRIRVEDVHSMLGTADETRLAAFAQKMIQRDAAGALRDLNDAAAEGVDLGQLAEQLLGYLRDLMALSVGASSDLVRTANPENAAQLKSWGEQWGTMTLISALQILDESIVKMRHSVQTRILMEIALVQICQLQDLQAIADLAKAFATGQTAPPPRVVTSGPVGAPLAPTPQHANNPSSVDSSKKKDELGASTERQSTQPENDTSIPTDPTNVVSRPTASATSPAASSNIAGPHVASTSASSPIEQSAAAAASSLPNSKPIQSPEISHPKKPAEPMAPSNRATEPASSSVVIAGSSEPGNELSILTKASEKLGGLIVQCVAMVLRVVPTSIGQWRAYVCRDGQFSINYLLSADNVRKLSGVIKEISGQDVQIEYILTQEPARAGSSSSTQEAPPVVEPVRVNANQAQLIRGVMHHSLVKHIVEKFDGQIVRVDQPAMARPPQAQSEEEASVPADALV
ncbi:MAG: DNA polymerase III subunit gamma/tau [Pirellula sp.]|nr:DNA polymerase III subunit gamma/tau [Pirellula sp.]